MLIDTECPRCDGEGEAPPGAICPACEGSGVVAYDPEDEIEGWMI